MISEGRVGVVVGADGVQEPVRLDRTLAQVITQAHGRYGEIVRRGNVYSFATALAGVTAAAGMVSPLAAGATPLLAVYNPSGSGKNLELLFAYAFNVSGTPAAGPMAYSLGPTALVTAVGAQPTSNLSGIAQGSVARGFSNSALTGSSALLTVRPAFFSQVGTPGAIAAAQPAIYQDELSGSIIVQPGSLVAICPAGAGTTYVLGCALTWEEVPV
jgi:hypothetical protein